MNHETLSRRTVVRLAGTATAAALVAGCIGDDDGGNTDPEAWEDVDEIVLEGHTSDGWTGVEPDAIADVENPTLVLFAGREYEITWENADGATHNIALWDDGGDPLERTEGMDDEGETQTLTFEATAEMVEYVCEWHVGPMQGDLEIHDE
ncbi:plastocyanin/azurin family copper-binding protein [Halobacteria archaeon AArc-m2/3/4]|uniref:Plastocyanin/azurin family copper-binding protein n=1 Tax=Natronoglomus mannanivorans TaxID=2979990 RepID=A0AAP2Z3A7_9EURY|nr:plastocyanin/azurin family copper-binding protein [Halobacteria archaeon AArc-xg1-1]MCU4972124.1 plastocyanin/azurin family copper-binding protein [Halobacteria archaeon AArc-m2/3/4]